MRFESLGEVPASASVRHYDELGESLQTTVADAEAAGGPTVTLDPFQAALVDEYDCDFVRFTDYHRLRRVEGEALIPWELRDYPEWRGNLSGTVVGGTTIR